MYIHSQELLANLKANYDKYYEQNDAAHGLSHIEQVLKNSEDIVNMESLTIENFNMDLLTIAVYIHDIFTNVSRDKHHALASNHIMQTSNSVLDKLSDIEKTIVSFAVREHRGSYNGSYSTFYSEILSAADRGLPDLQLQIIRSAQYTISKTQHLDFDDLCEKVRYHMVDKFSRTGYARYPNLYLKWQKQGLNKMYDDIDKLTKEEVGNVIRRINEEYRVMSAELMDELNT